MFVIRRATRADVPVVHELIKGLAEFERRPQDVTGSEASLAHWLFGRRVATVLIGELEGRAVGYALYYPVFGSFAAEGRVHLEDLFVLPELRGEGLGRRLLARVAVEVLAEGYTGMEWSALAWNTPAVRFYTRMGATEESGRTYMTFSHTQLMKISRMTEQSYSGEG